MKASLLLLFFFHINAQAAEIITNNVSIANAPAWLKKIRVEKVTDQIQKVLEWDIRRVTVIWYQDQNTFQKIHGYGPSVLAFSRPSDNTVHVGPKVNDGNFDGVFGHELSHVILFQKYKGAIPKWLEEGLANYMAKRGEIDYHWLVTQPVPDVKTMVHPFKAAEQGINPKYHYMASSALMEMIASKCNIHDLLQLSVGAKLESYLDTFCGIPDVNAAFKAWLKKKAS